MTGNKTTATDARVADYFAAIADVERRQDWETLARLMTRVTKEAATIWGTAIVGFGSYHYRYESGREGDSCIVGFSSRKGDISVYLVGSFPGRDELLSRLGPHRTAKACLYLRSLDGIDMKILEALIAGSVAERRRLHG